MKKREKEDRKEDGKKGEKKDRKEEKNGRDREDQNRERRKEREGVFLWSPEARMQKLCPSAGTSSLAFRTSRIRRYKF
jgi:hypothetical protein